MLRLEGLYKQYGSRVLLEGADAFLGPRARIALIGPNGAGKSTLIRMILGQEEPDRGHVSRANRLLMGHLAQEMPRFGAHTVIEEVMRLDGRREELLATRRELEERLAHPNAGDDPKMLESDLGRLGHVIEELENLDEYRLESRAKSILSGMGFGERDYHRSLSEFSGGWLMRVALSRILLLGPDLLLLDEPTNHLDLESLLWLENFLRVYPGAMLLVSHDREFLNRLVDEVWEVDARKIQTYAGNLDSYVAQKEERLTLLRAQYEGQQAKIAETMAFVRRFGAKASKARQAQSRLKQLDKMERIELAENRAQVRFRFPPAPHSGREVMTVKKACLNFGDKPVFRDLDWVLQRGSRVAIVGVNGAGKTTLLRLIAGQLAPTSGQVTPGHQVARGYYAQHQAESLNMDHTIFEELQSAAPEASIAQVRGIAGAFLFSGDLIDRKCRVLSGGEKARVALAKLLLTPVNFLLLDEPTNHLDIESREVLLEALQDFEGTLCLVSHDRAFVAPLVDTVLEILPTPQGSRVEALIGGYEDYLVRKEREASMAQASLKREPRAEETKRTGTPTRSTPSANQRKAWERERDRLEADITKLETSLVQTQNELSAPEAYKDPTRLAALLEQQKKFETELETKMRRWEELIQGLSEG